MIYLDNSATTRPHPGVIETVKRAMENYYGNPSSLHQKGVEAENVLKQARKVAAQYLGCKEGEIIFTSGGTESNNTAIKGIAFQYQNRGKHIVTTQVEHPAVYDVCKQLEGIGFAVTYLPVDREGRVSVEDVKRALRPDTILVSVMHVNNELGTIQPVEEIGQWLKQYPKVLFHVDAVQGIGKVPLSLHDSGIDLLSVSAHKFYGPRGVGILYKREGLIIHPLMMGGGQEAGVRSGTENLPAIAGMAKAIRVLEELGKDEAGRLQSLNQRLREGIERIEGCIVNTPQQGAAPHIMNLSVPGVKAEVLLHALEERGFLVSTKSACSSKANEPSRVLTAVGIERDCALSSLRISLGRENTREEIEQFLTALEACVETLRSFIKPQTVPDRRK
ncbi:MULTISPECIES: cysteine desulfurase family protein [Brevibacillus]|uniref:cysteine desulfurase family protein n=1 Tax=Brevibacillus TaxID=55080 RepID=UPI000EB89EDF|nr:MULTISPECIES: cysteine desulfurase family protein [Brevibacillus]NRQ57066.1 cysteine desulfurase [Brevibacillus sp. HD1.4A]MBU8714302.1 IscS subfamily cysteine desulfurase [Brevibacillus parabrevis]MDH6351480.1 cysteine desulfurase [Brevibacillus sp. 1238]MDR4998855.1 cysteine desulfurase family protein [Brevibacillus parabrevis]UED67519.1 cysteine desulfurase [Brevibacillus sp. HD3.3A]